MSISVLRQNGQMKDTARNALANRAFVVHICNEAIIEEVNKTAASLGPAESELDLTTLHTIQSEVVDVPAIQEAPVRFE